MTINVDRRNASLGGAFRCIHGLPREKWRLEVAVRHMRGSLIYNRVNQYLFVNGGSYFLRFFFVRPISCKVGHTKFGFSTPKNRPENDTFEYRLNGFTQLPLIYSTATRPLSRCWPFYAVLCNSKTTMKVSITTQTFTIISGSFLFLNPEFRNKEMKFPSQDWFSKYFGRFSRFSEFHAEFQDNWLPPRFVQRAIEEQCLSFFLIDSIPIFPDIFWQLSNSKPTDCSLRCPSLSGTHQWLLKQISNLDTWTRQIPQPHLGICWLWKYRVSIDKSSFLDMSAVLSCTMFLHFT